jgi:NADPH:quinone reductase-like Zn-dependent oxidoreductase
MHFEVTNFQPSSLNFCHGAGVRNFQVGHDVFGFASGCLGDHCIAEEHFLASMPSILSYEEAATTPTTYITAITGLENKILQEGQKVPLQRRPMMSKIFCHEFVLVTLRLVPRF